MLCIVHIIMRYMNFVISLVYLLCFPVVERNSLLIWLCLIYRMYSLLYQTEQEAQFFICSWCILSLCFLEPQNNFYKIIKWFCKSDFLIFLTNTISCVCVSLSLSISLSVCLCHVSVAIYVCICACEYVLTHRHLCK